MSAPVGSRTAYVLLALVIVLWGSNWPIMKMGLDYIGPMTFSAARMVMAALCMFPLVAVLGRLHLPRKGDWPIVLSVGGLQMCGFMVLVNFALLHVEAGRSSILAYTTPLWVLPGAVLIFGERVGWIRALGFALGMAGVAVLFNPLGFDWTDGALLLGNGLLLLAALIWATQILMISRWKWVSPPLELVPWQFLVASCLLLPVAIALEGGRPVEWDAEIVAILVFNGPVATAFCFWAVVTLNRALPAVATSLGLLGVPASGVAFSAFLLGEPVTATKALGLGLIVGGLALNALGDRGKGGAPVKEPGRAGPS